MSDVARVDIQYLYIQGRIDIKGGAYMTELEMPMNSCTRRTFPLRLGFTMMKHRGPLCHILATTMAFREQLTKEFLRYARLGDVIKLEEESEVGFRQYQGRESRYSLRDCYPQLHWRG
jgi:hypothetical protein